MTNKSKNIKKELISWLLPLSVLGVIYITGLHRHLAAGLQQMVVAVGIIKPETNLTLDQKPAIDYSFRLRSVDGDDVNFEDLRGKVVFMNFWATWCPPCIAEMPDIHALYESLNNDKVAFVMISKDKALEDAKKYLNKKGFTFPVYQPLDPLPETFSLKGIPTTFVISKDGKIAMQKTGMATYNTRAFKAYLHDLAEL